MAKLLYVGTSIMICTTEPVCRDGYTSIYICRERNLLGEKFFSVLTTGYIREDGIILLRNFSHLSDQICEEILQVEEFLNCRYVGRGKS